MNSKHSPVRWLRFPHVLLAVTAFCAPTVFSQTCDVGLDLVSGFTAEPDAPIFLPLPGTQVQSRAFAARTPIIFERNEGQTAAEVAFLSRGRGYTLFLAKDEAVLLLNSAGAHEGAERLGLRQPSAAFGIRDTMATAPEGWHGSQPHQNATAPQELDESRVLRMRLVGANALPNVHGEEMRQGKANYFIGNQPTLWRTNIPTFGKVRYMEIYPGIDLVYYGNEGRLEYDFVVAPGADPNQIAMEFDGAEELKVDPYGDLVLAVGGKEVRWQKPLIYQEVNGRQIEIAGRYCVRRGDDSMAAATGTSDTRPVPNMQWVSFELAAYDPGQPLVIDPILVYSTYLGGSGVDHASAVGLDNGGNVYVSGGTGSIDFPTKTPFQPNNSGGTQDAFVSKFSPAGELIFSTYLGGSGDDQHWQNPNSIAVTPDGVCYVFGNTDSFDFPVVNAFQPFHGGGDREAFLTALRQDGSGLLTSSYLGGSDRDSAVDIKVGSAGDVYAVGWTRSFDFPTLNALQPELISALGPDGLQRPDAFVIRFEPGGQIMRYSTFYGRQDTSEFSREMVVDHQGNVYLCMWVVGDYPRSQWAIVKIRADGGQVLFYRRFPDTMRDYFPPYPCIGLDSVGAVLLGGEAGIPTLPAVNKPHPSMITDGWGDAYLARFNSTNGAFLSGVYLGGKAYEQIESVSGTPDGDILAVGYTGWLESREPSGFPVTNPIESGPTAGTSSDVFVAKFRSSDLSLTFSTLFGGPGDEIAVVMAFDARGKPWIVGDVLVGLTNAQLPTLNAFQPQPGGGGDAFLVNLSLRDARVQISRSGQNVTLSWPVEAADYVLEASASLVAPSWDTVTNTPTVTATERTVQLPITGDARFFRLRKP